MSGAEWVQGWLAERASADMLGAVEHARGYPAKARAALVRFPPGTVVACSCGGKDCEGIPVLVLDVAPGPCGNPMLVTTDRPGSSPQWMARPGNPKLYVIGYKPGLSPFEARALLGRRGQA